jgi:hypothetical protein
MYCFNPRVYLNAFVFAEIYRGAPTGREVLGAEELVAGVAAKKTAVGWPPTAG